MKSTPLHDWVLIRIGQPSEKSAAEVEGNDEQLVLVREEDVLGTKTGETAMHWSIGS